MSDFEPFDDELAAALQRRVGRRSTRAGSRPPPPTTRCSPGRAASGAGAPASPAGRRWRPRRRRVPAPRRRRRRHAGAGRAILPRHRTGPRCAALDIGGPDTHDRAAAVDDRPRHQPRPRRPSPDTVAPPPASPTCRRPSPRPRPRPPPPPSRHRSLAPTTDPHPDLQHRRFDHVQLERIVARSLSTQPAAGHTAEIEDDTPTRIRVRFRGPADSRIEVRVEGGVPVVDID